MKGINKKMDILSLIHSFSYLGFFIIGFLSTALPFYSPPLYLSLPFILHKTHLSAILATLLTALGMTVGELIPYYIGYASKNVFNKRIEETKIYKKFSYILDRYGLLILPIISAIPFPLFDLVAISYGLTKMDVKTFFILVFAGKLIKTSYVVVIGLYALTHFKV